MNYNILKTIFSVQSLPYENRVLKKASIKIVVRAIYTYRFFFFYIHPSLLRQIEGPLLNYIYYKTILVWGLISVRIANAI